MDNITICDTYIPGIDEYKHALGSLWYTYVIIGTVTTFGLFMLFIEQAMYNQKNAHSSFRNCIIWIISMCPFMSFITILGFVIPSAWQVLSAVKIFYLMIGISKFADLTLLMYGSEEVMLWTLSDSQVTYNVPPFCFCRCLPTSKTSKNIIRMILHGCYQLPFTQSFYSISLLVLTAAEKKVIGSQVHSTVYVWLVVFRMCTSFLGIYSLNILARLSLPHLYRYQYGKKSLSLRLLILTTAFQSTIFDTLERYKIFPCYPPISHYTYRITIEACFYITEMLIFGLYFYGLYHNLEFKNENPSVLLTDPLGKAQPYKKIIYLTSKIHSTPEETTLPNIKLDGTIENHPQKIYNINSDLNNWNSFCNIERL